MNTNHYTEEENLSGSHDDELFEEIPVHHRPLGTFSVSSELAKKATPEMKLAIGRMEKLSPIKLGQDCEVLGSNAC